MATTVLPYEAILKAKEALEAKPQWDGSVIWDDPLTAKYKEIMARSTSTEGRRTATEIREQQSKEKPMELFKFITTKPPVLDLWNTILKADISPSDGIPANDIKFFIFIILQLHSSFKDARAIVNKSGGAVLKGQAAKLINVEPVSLTDLPVKSTAYPNWVHEDLYSLYYKAKLLQLKGSTRLLDVLFDRSTNDISANETLHILADYQAYHSHADSYAGCTLWMIDYADMNFYFHETIRFEPNRTPTRVTSKEGMSLYIRDALKETISGTEEQIIAPGTLTLIPQFQYKPKEEIPF